MPPLFLTNRLSRWLTLLALALLSSSAAWAQSTANYAFTTSSTGSLVDMSSGTTDALATGTYRDDVASAVQPIGFTFAFMGTPYTQFSVNSNGQLQLGASTIAGTQASPSSGLAILAPFGGDNAVQAAGKVHYKVLPGTNRTLVVEWNSLRIPYSSTVGTGSVVQALLEENTGKVEYRYGTVYNNSTSITRPIFISAGTSAGQIGVVKTFTTAPTYDATVTSATTTALPDNAAVPLLSSTADGARTVFSFTPLYSGTPLAPSVSATAITQTGLTLVITDNSTNETFFTVSRSTDNTTFTSLGTVASTSFAGTGSTLNFAQTGLTPGTTYYYRVTSNNEAGGTSANGTYTAVTQPAVAICGTKTVGPGTGADYATLTAALAAVSINGVCGPLVLELQSSYVSTTETFPLVYGAIAGVSATNTVTIRPAAGATGLSITGTAAGAVFNIAGGKYLILDGRPGGSGSPVSGAAAATDLLIASTSTSGIPLQFTSDATFNTVQHVQVKGVGTSDFSYPDVNFTGTVTTTGNSDNTVQYSSIGDGATTPVTLIYSGNTLNARNTISNNNLFNFYNASGASYGIEVNQAGSGWVITGNSIYQTATRNSVAYTHYGIYVVSGNGHTISNNSVGGSAASTGGTPWTVGGTAAAYRFVGIYLSTSGTATSVQGNSIGNFTWVSTSGATTTYGIWSGIYLSSGDANIGTLTGNTIGATAGPVSVSTTTTGGYSFGISTASSGTTSIVGNTIGAISGVGSTTSIASNVAGILAASGATNTISRNKIYGLASGSGGATISTGIWLNGGTTNNVNNNLIGDLRAPASTSLVAVSGILVASGTTNNVAFNTIRLDGTSTGATFGTQGIYLNSTSAVLNLYNNIVVNLSTPVGTGGTAVAIRRISGTAGTVPANLFGNNNLYYAGTPSATNLIYTEGTTTQTNAQQTLAAYKAFLLNREANSVTESNTPFASTTGSSATFLHLTAGAATQAESAGQPFGGITTDYDGDTRNASTPDIGADEGAFQLLDLSGPTITITGLNGSAANTTSRTLTATITDPSGIATGTNAPRLYFRKGASGAFTASPLPTVAGSTYTFTFDYSLIGGVTAGDVIYYYVAAQDALGNASTNPTGGAGATPPSVVYVYTVLTGLNGTYYVGTSTSPDPSRTYATLTAAANAYSGGGLFGPVTFLLLDNTYSATTGETFPIAFFNNADASATNTLTIRPNAGANPVISAAGSVLALASSRYVTIDGSNTVGGTTRNLTFNNTSTTTGTYGLGLVLQTGQPQTNQFTTVRNVNVTGNGSSSNVTYGILLSGADNDNVTLSNNSVQGTYYGIFANGSAATSAGGLDNLVLSNNVVGPATASVGANNIGVIGIVVQNAVGPVVTGNTVQNVGLATAPALTVGMNFATGVSNATVTGNTITDVRVTAGSYDALGMNLGTSFTGGVVDRNRILNIVSTSSTYGGRGLDINTGTATSNLRVSNNFIAGINGYGWSSLTSDAIAGIRLLGTTGGVGLYYNSVNLSGNYAVPNSSTYLSAALYVASGVTGVDIRNNIFVNTLVNGTSTSKAYAFNSAAGTSAYTALDYNDYFVAGTQGVLASFGSDVATLAALRTADGQDSHSVSTDPLFVSTTDLHATALVLNNAGTPIATVTTDIDGDTRSTTTPDIGADEFITNLDISVAGLTAPVANSTCFGTTETVTASITNSSTVALNFASNPVTVTVTITPVTATGTVQTFTTTVNTGTLAAGASQAVTFATTANLSALGTYTATATAALVGDDNTANNLLASAVTITSGTRSATFTYPTATICAGATGTVAATLGTGATAGTFSSTTGLTINATTGVITPATSTAGTYTVTNTLPATATCPAITSTQSVTITPATSAAFTYSGTSFCVSGTTAPVATVTGTSGGTFSSTTGLSLNATTGAITLASSTPGTYTVTYSVAGPCPSTTTRSVTITAAPVATFSYGTTTTYCVSGTTNPTVSLGTGATAGTFSSTTGLSLNATTGAITLASSTPGTYTVTNTVAAANGCAATTATTTVTITAAPVATFSYGATTTYCVSGTSNPAVVLGTGATAGTFSSTAGLTINATTGAITLASSTPGTYTVTNTVAAANGCAATSATATVTITAAPLASFSYPTATICAGQTATVTPALGTGATAGTFSSTTGLTINATTGVITPATSTAGTYTVTNTVAAANGCAAVTSTASVTILPVAVATFSYGSPATFCVSGTTNPTVSLGTGATAGTFSSTAGLTINATTGAITLATSTPGTYTVTNTVAASGAACGNTATTTVTITAAPVATFSYATTSGCEGSTTALTPTLGTGATAGTFSSTAGLTINATTGAITLASSTAGTYTVTNTVAASGGCAASTATTTFTVNPRPAAPVLTATYNGSTTTLTSSAATGNQFYLGGVAIAGATGTTYTVTGLPAQLGSYTVTTTNANGCVSLPSNVLVVSAAKNSIAGASVRLYPNPSPTGQVTVELTGFRTETQLTVLDALGRVVSSQLLPANAGTAVHSLDLSGMATGVYLLRLRNADGVETRRIVRD